MAKGYHPFKRRSSDPIHERNSSEQNNNSYSAPSSSRISMSALRRGLTLPLNNMAIPIYTGHPPSREHVEVGGRVLFHHFIQEELLHHGIPDEILEIENPPPDAFGDVSPEVMHGVGSARAESPSFLGTPDGYKTASFIAIGGNIRNIADQFAYSHERSLIKEQADEVDLSHISYSTFQNILSELFKDGINKYRIVSLFYFCSDVLIRCVKNELHKLGSKLFFWALEFLLKNVCKWVQEHGGWERVFSNVFTVAYNVSLLAALGVVICCGFLYMKKNM